MPPENVPDLVAELTKRGVQLWHNRGRIYAGPIDLVTGDERALLHYFKDPLVAYLKRHPSIPARPRRLIAPSGPAAASWEGQLSRKPWHYELTVVLPTLGPVDLLETSLTCWRHQSVSPYFVVIDTGSADEHVRAVEALRGPDCEIHTIGCHGWRHSSAPVSAALDLAFAVCQTDYALLTHTDVFPRHQRVIEDLLGRFGADWAAVGYQMSRRQGSDEWMQCLSHTLTLVNMRLMRRHRITWNLLAVLEAEGELDKRYQGWPDTETQFGRSLRQAGEHVHVEMLGCESNAALYQTDRIVHWRSTASLRQYAPREEAARHPGLGEWLRRTRQLGVAADLPEWASAETGVTGQGGHKAH